MPKSSADYETEFLAGLKTASGKDLESWMRLATRSGHEKHNAVLNFFKKDHGFNHMQANFLAAIFRNGGRPVYADSSSLMDALFEGKEAQRKLYESLEKKIVSTFAGVKVVPTKGYISFRSPREFAVARVTKDGIRVGMDLGSAPFVSPLTKSKSLGAMPRISHMIEVAGIPDIDVALLKFLQSANTRVNAS